VRHNGEIDAASPFAQRSLGLYGREGELMQTCTNSMIALEIQSIGSPPTCDADRIVSAMMKYLAKEHAKLWQEIYDITKDPASGTAIQERSKS
jgi:hypothetical protein